MAPILALDAVSKRFDAVVIADDISLALPEGEALGVLGPNGAGKTTLFGIITGTVPLDSGHVRFAGSDITGFTPERRCRRGIARSFQIPQPFGAMTVFENLAVAAAFGQGRGEREIYRECWAILERCGLADKANRMVEELGRAREELSDLARTLEERVRERTAEMQGLQAELVRTQKLAAVGKLAAGVAHEINNPLTAVLTHSSLLLDELPEGDPRREDLRLVVDETLRCRGIVRSLLDFARQSPTRRVTLDLNAAVLDVQALLRAQPNFRAVSLFNHLAADLPPAFADPDQVRQVILNLYLNAVEAMPEGGQVVTATAAPVPGAVELTIADSGEGLAESMKNRLFEPFATTKKTGTGLGLAVVYGIIEAHGGSIALEPSRPRGTLARVRLPTLEAGGSARGPEAPESGGALA